MVVQSEASSETVEVRTEAVMMGVAWMEVVATEREKKVSGGCQESRVAQLAADAATGEAC